MSKSDKSVTVIVACRNENPRIGRLLGSLSRLDRTGLRLNAIVADGMSTDGTRQILENFRQSNGWFEVLDNPGLIVSTGLNLAIRRARGEFIVRMDAHTVYEPDYVVRSIAVLEATGAANVGGPQRSRAEDYWGRAIRAGYHSAFASGGASFRGDTYRGPVDTVPYGCWRRDFLIAVGLFDETLVRNQDDELNLRIRLAGGVVWLDPEIVSWYSPRSSLRGLFRQYLQFGFWRVAVMRKHPSAGRTRHYVPGTALLTGICLALAAARGNRPAAWSLLALGGIYAALSLWVSLAAARREGWDLLPALPVTFAVYQTAYAAGFCAGLVYWGLCRPVWRTVPRIFSAVKRS